MVRSGRVSASVSASVSVSVSGSVSGSNAPGKRWHTDKAGAGFLLLCFLRNRRTGIDPDPDSDPDPEEDRNGEPTRRFTWTWYGWRLPRPVSYPFPDNE